MRRFDQFGAGGQPFAMPVLCHHQRRGAGKAVQRRAGHRGRGLADGEDAVRRGGLPLQRAGGCCIAVHRRNPGVPEGQGEVAGGAHVSIQIVTGPSLVSDTAMSAPKRPVATGRPCAAIARAKCS